ncbi:MAG: cupin domain-containing protein [Actinomycetes bacterium]
MANDESLDETPEASDEATEGEAVGEGAEVASDLPWGWDEAGDPEQPDGDYVVEIWNDYDPSMRFVVVYTVGEDQGATEGSVAYYIIEPGKHTGLHSDNAEEIIYVSEGVGESFVSGKQVKFEPGTFIVIPRGVEHDIYAYGDADLKFLSFFTGGEVISTFQVPILPMGGTTLSSKPPKTTVVTAPIVEELDPENLPENFPFSLADLGMASDEPSESAAEEGAE